MSGSKPKDTTALFNAKIQRSDGCWEWLGGKRRAGYGQFRVRLPKPRNVAAHRFSYELANGPIPSGLCVLHRCDNPGCVRPDHLFLGSQADNLRDMVVKGRAHVGVGRSLTRENAYAILWREASSEPHKKLAAEYGVVRQTVGDIAHRRRWQSLSQSHD